MKIRLRSADEVREVPLFAYGDRTSAATRVHGGPWLLAEGGRTFAFEQARTDGGASGPISSGAILAPMPGRIIAVEVAQGQAVAKGQKLVTLEAMKMEHNLTAPFDGTVAELVAAIGAQVQVDAVLARVEPADAA